ncbi:MAG: hypothetical protein VXY24_03985, partial [Pseudomonadota bacterium]|nr:hypothetical protein [Pseudomonadota bacterium]
MARQFVRSFCPQIKAILLEITCSAPSGRPPQNADDQSIVSEVDEGFTTLRPCLGSSRGHDPTTLLSSRPKIPLASTRYLASQTDATHLEWPLPATRDQPISKVACLCF